MGYGKISFIVLVTDVACQIISLLIELEFKFISDYVESNRLLKACSSTGWVYSELKKAVPTKRTNLFKFRLGDRSIISKELPLANISITFMKHYFNLKIFFCHLPSVQETNLTKKIKMASLGFKLI